jgi:carboxyl-terminal processing protease
MNTAFRLLPLRFANFQKVLSAGVLAPAALFVGLSIEAPMAWAATEAADLGVLADTDFEDSPKAVLDEAWQIVHHEYVDGTFNHVDWVATRTELLGREYTSQEAAYSALRSALQQLNDPYTRFLSPSEYADLTDQTSGEVSGIGIRLRRDSDSGAVLVTEVLAGSPAERAGLQENDQVLVVDGQSTDRLTPAGVFQALRGAEGSQVTLTISRGEGSSRTIVVTRARVEIPTVEYALNTTGNRSIGYIRLIEFNAHAAEQMEEAILSLAGDGVDGYVLDLRGNPGGLLLSSIDISRMWLQHGPIVRTLERDGTDDVISANRTALTNLPLTVLVDGRSASSSEILTGALQDNGRAMVVGTTTFGKALVQSLHGLADGSGLTVTVAHYYTPSGTDISRKGITPDVEVAISDRERRELLNDPALLGTPEDAQYLQAVQVLEQTIAGQVTPVNRAVPSQLGLVETEQETR